MLTNPGDHTGCARPAVGKFRSHLEFCLPQFSQEAWLRIETTGKNNLEGSGIKWILSTTMVRASLEPICMLRRQDEKGLNVQEGENNCKGT